MSLKEGQCFWGLILMLFILCLVPTRGLAEKGIKAGGNWAKSSGAFFDDPAYKLGFIGGAFFTHNLTDLLSLQPELFYSMKGYIVESNYDDSIDVRIDVGLHYIEIPLLAKLRVVFHQIGEVHVYGGPGIGFMISGKYKSRWGDTYYEGDLDDLNRYEVGVVFGASAALQVWRGTIILDVRANDGLTGWDASNDNYKNRTLSLMLGYCI